jgi:hypothetical protein
MSKTQLAVLWVLGVLIVAVLGALGWMLSQSKSATAPAVTPSAPAEPGTETGPVVPPAKALYRLPETAYTARNLYGQAQGAALAWQPDAALVSAAATWPFAGLDDFSRPVDWTYQFYSPATGRISVINVGHEGVTPVRETLSPYRLPTIDVNQWRVDSHTALNVWLNRGGGPFLKSQAVVDVSIRLSRPADDAADGAAVWTIVGVDESGQDTYTERVSGSEEPNR